MTEGEEKVAIKYKNRGAAKYTAWPNRARKHILHAYKLMSIAGGVYVTGSRRPTSAWAGKAMSSYSRSEIEPSGTVAASH